MRRIIKSLHSHTSPFCAPSWFETLISFIHPSKNCIFFVVGDNNPFESADDFEKRLFGSDPKSSRSSSSDGPITDSFCCKLDRIEKRSSSAGFGPRSRLNAARNGGMEGFDTFSDEMDDKLRRAATTFQVSDEILNDDYAFRPDVNFIPGSIYTPRDLDLTKPGIPKSYKRTEFETTTTEVLRKADFGNVRFLSNFLTEAGIIVKRSQTKISAKAQRKVAREIKTARAFGLMPFTIMGTKPFVFGNQWKMLRRIISMTHTMVIT